MEYHQRDNRRRCERKHHKEKETKKQNWISTTAIEIAEKRRKAKARGNVKLTKKLNADFQRQIRRDKEVFLNDQCKEIEEANSKKRSRDMFQKIKEITGHFTPKLGVLKSANGKDLTEENDIKNRWQ